MRGYYATTRATYPTSRGIDDFEGTVVHPQFWPDGLDYTGKRVVVIGSGATAVTLIPAMALMSSITMLQRSPTWISALPRTDPVADVARKYLPPRTAHRPDPREEHRPSAPRSTNSAADSPNGQASCSEPRGEGTLADEQAVAEHFTHVQRLGSARLRRSGRDLFAAIKRAKAEVVTDHIDTIVAEGIRVKSGRLLEADIIVTATGLKPSRSTAESCPWADGAAVSIHDQFVLLGAMITGIPISRWRSAATNASWDTAR